MAIKPKDIYGSRVSAVDTSMPDGKAINLVGDVVGTGTPLEAAWINDIWGTRQAILKEAGITPDGTTDNADDSQVLDGLKKILNENKNYLGVKALAEAVADLTAYEGGYVKISDRAGGIFRYSAVSTGTALYTSIECPLTSLYLIYQPEGGVVNMASCGAVADNGVTDNTAAFLAATDLGITCFLPYHMNYYAGDIVLNDDQEFTSNNATIKPITFGITHGNRSTAKGFNIVGNGKGVGSGMVGVSALGKLGTMTQDFRISDINGDAYQRNEGVDRHQGNHLHNFIIKDSVTGLNEGTRGEYNKTSVGSIFGCDEGIKLLGGNNIYSCVSVTDNLVGVHLYPSANDSHGVCSGLSINHNGRNIQVDANTIAAFTFANCELYAGDIWLIGSTGIHFVGGEVSIAGIYEEGCRDCHFIGTHFVEQVIINPNYNGAFSEVYYHDSCVLDDANMIRPTFFNKGSKCEATQETNILGVADGTTIDLLDTRKANALSGNAAFAWVNFFEPADQAFKMARNSKINSLLVDFTGIVTVTRDASHFDKDDVLVIFRNASSVAQDSIIGQFAGRSVNGTLYTTKYLINGQIPRQNADYKLQITNNTGGDIDVYRDQFGSDFLCNLTAWGW